MSENLENTPLSTEKKLLKAIRNRAFNVDQRVREVEDLKLEGFKAIWEEIQRLIDDYQLLAVHHYSEADNHQYTKDRAGLTTLVIPPAFPRSELLDIYHKHKSYFHAKDIKNENIMGKGEHLIPPKPDELSE